MSPAKNLDESDHHSMRMIGKSGPPIGPYIHIELLVSILFPIFDELLKIPEINVFLSPLSGGMAPEKFHWHIKKCFRFNFYRFILKYFLLETVCFLITLVHIYQLLIGFKSSLMGWKSSHVLAGALWLVKNCHSYL